MAKWPLLGLLVLLGGCQLLALERQMQSAQQQLVLIPGQLQDSGTAQPALVALLNQQGRVQTYRIVQPNGLFYFSMPSGDYQLLAFEDHNGNLLLDTDEPRHWLQHAQTTPFQVQPSPAERARLGKLNRLQPEPATVSVPDIDLSLDRLYRDLPRLQRNYLQVVDFADPRFSAERISQGAWQPLDFLSEVGYGLYLLQPWDPDKEPIFLVHGINSAPPAWSELVDSIDPERFQVLLYHYPSGLPLNNSAYLLSEAIRDVQLRYAPRRFHIFAHSMGGLVARRAMQLLSAGGGTDRQCLFLTLSTPWGGHPSAAKGLARSPVVAPVWRDLAPGSSYLQALFAHALPPHIRQWQLVSYGGNTRFLPQPNDGAVPLISELREAAQNEATRLYLLPDSHVGILSSSRSKELIGQALAGLPAEGCRAPQD